MSLVWVNIHARFYSQVASGLGTRKSTSSVQQWWLWEVHWMKSAGSAGYIHFSLDFTVFDGKEVGSQECAGIRSTSLAHLPLNLASHVPLNLASHVGKPAASPAASVLRVCVFAACPRYKSLFRLESTDICISSLCTEHTSTSVSADSALGTCRRVLI